MEGWFGGGGERETGMRVGVGGESISGRSFPAPVYLPDAIHQSSERRIPGGPIARRLGSVGCTLFMEALRRRRALDYVPPLRRGGGRLARCLIIMKQE